MNKSNIIAGVVVAAVVSISSASGQTRPPAAQAPRQAPSAAPARPAAPAEDRATDTAVKGGEVVARVGTNDVTAEEVRAAVAFLDARQQAALARDAFLRDGALADHVPYFAKTAKDSDAKLSGLSYAALVQIAAQWRPYGSTNRDFLDLTPGMLAGLNVGLASGLLGAYLPNQLRYGPSWQRILLIDAPAVLGWTKWREMDAKYGFGLLKRALGAAMQAGLIRRQDADVLTHILLGALTETAMAVARSDNPAKARMEAERALISMLAGLKVSK